MTTKPDINLTKPHPSGRRRNYTREELEYPGATMIEALEREIDNLDLDALGLNHQEQDLLRLRNAGAGWRELGRRVDMDHMTAKRGYIAAMRKLATRLTETML